MALIPDLKMRLSNNQFVKMTAIDSAAEINPIHWKTEQRIFECTMNNKLKLSRWL